jgi:ABC-type uncharacterized transport system permease subunit
MYKAGLIIFHISLISYLLGLYHFVVYALRGGQRWAQRGLWLALCGLAVHGISIVIIAFGQGMLPWANSLQNISFWCWVLVGISVAVSFRFQVDVLWLFLLPLVIVLLFTAMTGQKSSSAYGGDIGMTFWSAFHIGLVFVAYAAFAFAGVTGFMYILQSHSLKKKESGELYGKLPPLDLLDRLNYRALLAGFAFLTVGLLLGFFWLAALPQQPGGRDAKIVAALVTWGAYAILFLLRATCLLRGKKVAWLSILGVGVIILSFLFIPHSIPRKLKSTAACYGEQDAKGDAANSLLALDSLSGWDRRPMVVGQGIRTELYRFLESKRHEETAAHRKKASPPTTKVRA